MSRGAYEVEVVPSLTPAGAGTIADGAFELFRKQAVTLVLLSAATNVPLFAAIAGLVIFVRERGWAWGSFGYFATLGALSLAVAATAWLRAVGTGAMAHACASGAEDRAVGPAAALGAALRTGAALPLACAVRFAGVATGVAACLLPGLSVAGALAFLPHGVVLERRGVTDSMARSMSLATNGIVGLAGVATLALCVYAIGIAQIALAVRLAETVASLALPSGGGGWLARPEMPWLVLAVAKVLADPIVSAAVCGAWIDARIRADGTSLDLRIEAVSGARPALVSRGGAA